MTRKREKTTAGGWSELGWARLGLGKGQAPGEEGTRPILYDMIRYGYDMIRYDYDYDTIRSIINN